jgi:hypothetical protein
MQSFDPSPFRTIVLRDGDRHSRAKKVSLCPLELDIQLVREHGASSQDSQIPEDQFAANASPSTPSDD